MNKFLIINKNMKVHINKSLSNKLNLSYNTLLNTEKYNKDKNNFEIENKFNPFQRIITNYNEIQKLLSLNNPQILKIFFFNRNIIYDILYETEKIIDIKDTEEKKELSYYFYLDMLIMENPLLNFTYSFNLIKQINDLQKKVINTEVYKKVILSKIIIEVINNYKSNDNIEKELELYDRQLNEIINFNETIINNNIQKFEQYGIVKDTILSEKLDMIYVKIIIELIQKQKFESDDTLDIIKQLDLQNINLTENMYNELSQILDSKNKNVNFYEIKDINDLKDARKANFYYILLSYILKSSIYIYENDFLFKVKRKLRKLNSEQFLFTLFNKVTDNKSNSNINEQRIKYIIDTFSDSKYYYEKYSKNVFLKNENSSMSKNPLEDPDYKNKDTKTKDDHIMLESKTNSEVQKREEKKKSELYKNEVSYRILLESSYIFKVDEKGNSDFELIGEIKDNNNNILNFKNLKNIKLPDLTIKEPEKLEKATQLCNSYKKFLTFFPDFEKSIKNYVNKYYNLEINLDFIISDEMLNTNNNLFNMSATYTINKDNNNSIFKDSNILNYDSIAKADGFLFLTSEINEKS